MFACLLVCGALYVNRTNKWPHAGMAFMGFHPQFIKREKTLQTVNQTYRLTDRATDWQTDSHTPEQKDSHTDRLL